MTEARVAIVTGAGRGLGEAVARELKQRGYRLALMSRAGCVEVAEALGALALAGSVTEEADIQALVAATMERYGRIDAVVNNAGRHAQTLAEHAVTKTPLASAANLGFDPDFKPDIFAAPWQAWHDDLDLMVLNAMKMAKAVTPHMIAGGGGAIVNISGLESLQPRLVYPLGPIRQVLHGFTKLYTDRYGADGIRMNSVLPGLIENASSGFESDAARAVPLGRLGSVSEIAGAVAFLLSPEAGYITGQSLLVDGGLNRAP